MAGESIEKGGKNERGPPDSFQHVGLKITRLTTGGIKISNPKIFTKILKEKGLDCDTRWFDDSLSEWENSIAMLIYCFYN